MLDTLVEALTVYTVRQSYFCRQTDESMDQIPKQHHHLGKKNNFGGLMPPKVFFYNRLW